MTLSDASNIEQDLIHHIEQTNLFDEDWYLSRNTDVGQLKLSAIEHYIRVGEAEGRMPNRYFSPHWYRKNAGLDTPEAGSLLIHYAETGWKAGHDPSVAFSLSLYLKANPDVKEAGVEPLGHFLQFGEKEGRRVFATYDDEDSVTDIGMLMRAIKATGLFMGDWYLAHNFDLYDHGIDPLEHYVMAGSAENRKPNPYFDTRWYQDVYGEAIGDEHPLLYWAHKGHKLNQDPGPNFASDIYFAENPDLKKGVVDPLLHYLTFGRYEKRAWPDPNRRGSKAAESEASTGVRLPVDKTLRGLIDFPRHALKPKDTSFNPKELVIHWIVPDFAPGGGGHMTIFRMVHFLELSGHKQTIWIHNPSLHDSAADAYDTIIKYFQHFAGDVKFIDDSFADASGDIMIASDCFSIWPAMVPTDFTRRFYFVQDHEPSFHPVGSNAIAAEMTYEEDFDCICASPWLEQMMHQKYGKWASAFWLAADTKIYFPPRNKTDQQNDLPRIAVYARTFTARRLVELAFLALEVLARRGNRFHVDFFGAPISFRAAPFSFSDHGVASPDQLADLFRKADIGMVFSATNYSLVPQEMMACGLPVVEIDGESTRAIFTQDIVTYTKPDPLVIADTLEDLINDPDRRTLQSDKAYDWVRQFSWPQSARMVENALKARLADFGQARQENTPAIITRKPKASVVIPTLNPGDLFPKVLKAVLKQKTPFDVEILVIDSGSTDGTVDLLDGLEGVRLHQIDQKDFNHGDTRNLGVEMTEGDYVAFLTHDALPRDDLWLYSLVTGMDRFPDAGGVFGRHLAWPDASPYTKRDMEAHFDLFLSVPLYLDQETDARRFELRDPAWMQTLHFYSDNNSMLRRSVWEKIPLRRTAFGEDHLYAYDIIMAGYGKLYMPHATVYHSHDYDADQTHERCAIESAFFKHFFGYRLMKDEQAVQHALEGLNNRDEKWGRLHGLSESDISLQKQLNAARLNGHLEGALKDTTGLFD